MTLYHERRTIGATPLEALQYAQKWMLSDAKYPACLWAGFTVYGCQ
jgi:CHAT domain-containing protein